MKCIQVSKAITSFNHCYIAKFKVKEYIDDKTSLTRLEPNKKAAIEDMSEEYGPVSKVVNRVFGAISKLPPNPNSRPMSGQSVASSVYRLNDSNDRRMSMQA